MPSNNTFFGTFSPVLRIYETDLPENLQTTGRDTSRQISHETGAPREIWDDRIRIS